MMEETKEGLAGQGDITDDEVTSSEKFVSAQHPYLDSQRLLEEELQLRKTVASRCSRNIVIRFFINFYSTLLVFSLYLISIECLLSIALAVTMTVYTYAHTNDDDDNDFNGASMNWIILSFAVITPMSVSVSMAFKRREWALLELASLKGTILNIYSSHARWDWGKLSDPQNTGKRISSVDWEKHSDECLSLIMSICIDLTRLLTLPAASRARHRVTTSGRKESKEIRDIMFKLHRSILLQIARLTVKTEVLKLEGLPPNEATRIRNWELTICEKVDLLRTLKCYRTPQALRSFARLFTLFLPPFYAREYYTTDFDSLPQKRLKILNAHDHVPSLFTLPAPAYYAQLAKDTSSLGVGITFSILTAIALTSLFESISQMEDPFIGIVFLDGIDAQYELHDSFRQELLDWRKYFHPDLPPLKFEKELVPISKTRQIRLMQPL